MSAPALSVPFAADLGDWPGGKMNAAAITGPGRVELVEIPVPAPSPGEALVRVSKVGLCGTDLELLHGTASYVRDGRARLPHVFGHEWCGTVVAVHQADPRTHGISVGRRVVGHTMVSCGACGECHRGRRNLCQRLREVGLYGRQGAAAAYIRMPVHALTPVPDGVDDHAATLVEPAVTVLGALAAAEVGRTDEVAVVGSGTIGLLAVQALADRAGRVDIVGVDAAGLELARALGAERAYRPGEAPARGYSVVVEASGAVAAFAPAVALLAPGGRMAAVGVPDGPVDGLDATRLVLDGLTVRGIRHGLDHYGEALALFERGVLRAAPLVETVLTVRRAAEAFARLENGPRRAPKILLAGDDGDIFDRAPH